MHDKFIKPIDMPWNKLAWVKPQLKQYIFLTAQTMFKIGKLMFLVTEYSATLTTLAHVILLLH